MQDSTVSSLDEQIQQTANEAMRFASQYRESGELEQAATMYRAILEMQPEHPEAHFQLGLLEQQALNLPSAILHFATALRAVPEQTRYWLAYIDALVEGRDFATARAMLELGRRHGLEGTSVEALTQKLELAEAAPAPAEIDAVMALLCAGRLADADIAAHALLERYPRHVFGWKVLSGLQRMHGKLTASLDLIRVAADCAPDDAEVVNNLGSLLNELNRHEEAAVVLRHALALEPNSAQTHVNLALALRGTGSLVEAENSVHAALAIDPDDTRAHSMLGLLLQCQNRLVDAVVSYRRALALEPDLFGNHSNLLFCLSHMENIGAAELFAEHRLYGEKLEQHVRTYRRAHENSRDPDRELRIGFVSADLRNHAVATFIEPILQHLGSRPGFSIHAYYNHVIHDDVGQRLRGHIAHWHDVYGISDAALAEQIRADGIDILIDLSGHTGYNRLPMFAHKPAPIQATWIGYPGTTGLKSMDYYITDRFILPPGQFDDQFTEKLVYLPRSFAYQPELDCPDVTTLPAISNQHITFGSFNRLAKISRAVIHLWARLLRALPNAQLIMAGMPEDGNYGQLESWLEQEGVELSRVQFHPRSGMQEYLALHNQIDVCLDTFPYTGGTTTLHALWMGVPTLTLSGKTAAGRQSTCVLEHFGLHQFIAHDQDDFVRKGISICENPQALATLRGTLRGRMALPSSETMTDIADSVECALRLMWQRWCAKLPVEAFEVPGAHRG